MPNYGLGIGEKGVIWVTTREETERGGLEELVLNR